MRKSDFENIVGNRESAAYKHNLLIWGTIWLFNSFPNKPQVVFTCLQYKSFENTVEKGEIVFYLFWELTAIFIEFKIVVCKLFQFRRI